MAQLKETSLNLTLPLASVEKKEAGDENNEMICIFFSDFSLI